MHRSLQRLVAVLGLLLLSWVPCAASAQSQQTVLWLADVAPDAEVDALQVETVLQEILANAPDARHIVGHPGLTTAVERGDVTIPGCLEGTESCTSPEHALLQMLGVDLVVRVTALGEGESVELRVADGSMNPMRTARADSDDLRAALFLAVAELTDATAALFVTSSPSGAEVFVDGISVGLTPWDTTMPIGLYDVTLRYEGYFDDTTTLELRAGDSRPHDVTLNRRFALVTVRSGTPGLEVLVDGSAVPWPPNAPIQLDPGTRMLEMRAPGYTSEFRTLELAAGQDVDFSSNLLLSPEEIRRRERERILGTPLMLQLSIDLDGTGMRFDGAHGSINDADRTIGCPADALVAECANARGVFTGAISADALYAWRMFEVGLFGIGWRLYAAGSDDRPWLMGGVPGGVTLDRAHAVTVRLPSVGARWLFGPSIEPFFRTGPVVEIERLRVSENVAFSPEEPTLRRNSVWWEARAGVRWHFNRLMFAGIDGHVAGGLNTDDRARGGVSLQVGINLADPFGLDDALNARFGTGRQRNPDAAATGNAPQEL